MKKKNWLCLLLILFLAVGCGEKRLNCSQRIFDYDDFHVDKTVSLKFDKRKLTTGSLILDYYYQNNVEENVAVMKEIVENNYAKFKDIDGIKFIFRDTSNGFQFELEVEFDKLSDEVKEDLSLVTDVTEYDSYNEAREDLINLKYQCN